MKAAPTRDTRRATPSTVRRTDLRRRSGESHQRGARDSSGEPLCVHAAAAHEPLRGDQVLLFMKRPEPDLQHVR